MIYVIDDDEIMSGCIANACRSTRTGREAKEFREVLSAMAAISSGELPSMILMDVMLTGPDGFTFLNELISYEDTARVPVVLISTVDFKGKDLSAYGVVATLNKDSFTPDDVRRLVEQYAK